MAHPVPSRLNVSRATDSPATRQPERPKANNRLLIAERRRQAYRFRVVGMSAEAIALRLAADPAINTDPKLPDGYPGGYGAKNYYEGKPPPSAEQLRKEASADLALVHDRTDGSIDRDADFMFGVALDRIEFGFAAIAGRVATGSQLHVGRWVELIQTQAQLMGWNKSPVSVTVDNSINVTSVESPQPNWGDPEYMQKFLGAMVEAGAETPEMLAAAQATLAELPISTSAVDATTIEVTATEPAAE